MMQFIPLDKQFVPGLFVWGFFVLRFGQIVCRKCNPDFGDCILRMDLGFCRAESWRFV